MIIHLKAKSGSCMFSWSWQKTVSKCWKTLIYIKHLLNSVSANSYLHYWSFKDTIHMFFSMQHMFSAAAGSQEVIHKHKFLLNLSLIASRRMFNAVSCPTSQTIHQIVSYAWIVPLHTWAEVRKPDDWTSMISLVLMRCESHISNGISTCHFTLFQLLLHACSCQHRPALTAAGQAVPAPHTWCGFDFGEKLRGGAWAQSSLRVYVSFICALMKTTETPAWSDRTLLYITVIDPDLWSPSDG